MNAQGIRWLPLIVAALFVWTGCAGPKAAAPVVPRDAAYHRDMTTGHGAFERGDLERASVLYRQALQRARVMDRSAEIAAAAYHLALCRIALGDMEEGVTVLREAREEARRAGEPTVDAWLVEAEAQRRLGDTAAARTAIDRALTALDGLSAPALRVQAHTLRALLALDEGEVALAEEALAAAKQSVRKDTPHRLLARLEEIKGRLHLAADEAAWAAQSFDAEARLYRDGGRFEDMAMALARAASAHQQAGEYAAALDRYYRAARHQAARGRMAESLRLLERAVHCLEESPDDEAAVRIADLVAELQIQMKQTTE